MCTLHATAANRIGRFFFFSNRPTNNTTCWKRRRRKREKNHRFFARSRTPACETRTEHDRFVNEFVRWLCRVLETFVKKKKKPIKPSKTTSEKRKWQETTSSVPRPWCGRSVPVIMRRRPVRECDSGKKTKINTNKNFIRQRNVLLPRERATMTHTLLLLLVF